MWLDVVLSIRFVVGDCSEAAPVREQQEMLLTTFLESQN